MTCKIYEVAVNGPDDIQLEMHGPIKGSVVIVMRVSPSFVFPEHISLGMRVSPHIYH